MDELKAFDNAELAEAELQKREQNSPKHPL